MSVASTSASATATSSPAHRGVPGATTLYSEEYYTMADLNDLGQNEHYIYVTYPPELKRRLLERYLFHIKLVCKFLIIIFSFRKRIDLNIIK